MAKATLDGFRARLGTVSNVSNALLDEVLETAVSWVTERVYVTSREQPEVVEAEYLLASRLYKRRQSPEGVAGWGDLGVIRVLASDPDITSLLEHHLDMCKAGVA